MPIVSVVNNNKKIDGMMLRSLLVSLQVNDIPITTYCGGKALCGKCAVRILEGKKSLSPITSREEKKLIAMKAEANIRLACQAHPGRDVVIEVVNYGTEARG